MVSHETQYPLLSRQVEITILVKQFFDWPNNNSSPRVLHLTCRCVTRISVASPTLPPTPPVSSLSAPLPVPPPQALALALHQALQDQVRVPPALPTRAHPQPLVLPLAPTWRGVTRPRLAR
jgi:hypothetical protein